MFPWGRAKETKDSTVEFTVRSYHNLLRSHTYIKRDSNLLHAHPSPTMYDVDNPITGSHSCPSPTSKRSDIMSMPDSASQASDACTTVIVTVTPSVALLQALLGYIVPDSWAARDEYTGSNIGLAYKVGAMDYAQEVVSRATMPRPVRVEMKIPDGHQGGRNMAKQVVEVYAVYVFSPPPFSSLYSRPVSVKTLLLLTSSALLFFLYL